MIDYLLPTVVDQTTFYYMMALSIGLSFGTMIVGFKFDNTPTIFSGIIVGGVIMFGYVFLISGPELDQYQNEMKLIIETTDCSNLPGIARERESFKDEIVEEIVLRCLLEQDPVLVAWLQGAT